MVGCEVGRLEGFVDRPEVPPTAIHKAAAKNINKPARRIRDILLNETHGTIKCSCLDHEIRFLWMDNLSEFPQGLDFDLADAFLAEPQLSA